MIYRKLALASAMTLAGAVGWSSTVAAGPVIGFSPAGDGTNFVYADVWSDGRNTGVDVSLSDPGGPFAPGFNAGAVHQFNFQERVDSFGLGAADTTPVGLNNAFELTKEIEFEDAVASLIPIGGGNFLVNFVYTADAYNNLTLYRDDITDGTQSNNTTGGAECYGTGTSAAAVSAANPCSTDGGGGDGDGLPILTGNLIDNTSSFLTTSATTGNGSFQLVFEITSYDSDWLDLSNLPVNQGTGNPLYAMNMSGTLVIPDPFVLTPSESWNGNLVGGSGPLGTPNLLFRIDASEDFSPSAAPAPTSLLLLGAGLLGMRAFGRKKAA